MTAIIDTLKSYIKVKDIDDDSHAFKLFYRPTVALCILGFTLVLATQYFGDPITCHAEGSGIDSKLFNAHCWVHGAHHVPKNFDSIFSCVSKEVSFLWTLYVDTRIINYPNFF